MYSLRKIEMNRSTWSFYSALSVQDPQRARVVAAARVRPLSAAPHRCRPAAAPQPHRSRTAAAPLPLLHLIAADTPVEEPSGDKTT